MWNAVNFVMRTQRDQRRATPFRTIFTMVIFGVALAVAMRVLFGPFTGAINGI